MDVPVTYRAANMASASPAPATVVLYDNEVARFYARYLMKRAIAAVTLTIPDYWPENYVKYTLFGWGFGGIFYDDDYGLLFNGGTLSERDVFYQPRLFLLRNPLLPGKALEIHKDAVVVKLQPDYTGFSDIVEEYAGRLALAYAAWMMNTQNSKLAYVGMFKDKAAAGTFKLLFDEIQKGNPAAAVGKNLYDENGKPLWGTFTQDLRANYIAPEISDDMRGILNEFDSFVGIPNNPDYGKKERSVVDAVNVNNVETDTILDLAVKSLNEGFDEANALFADKLDGVVLRAEKRYKTSGTGDDDGGEAGA